MSQSVTVALAIVLLLSKLSHMCMKVRQRVFSMLVSRLDAIQIIVSVSDSECVHLACPRSDCLSR